MLFIFILNSVSRDSLFLLVENRKGWFDSYPEFPVREKTLYDVVQTTSQPHPMLVFHHSKPPGGVVSLFKIKEGCYKVLFLYFGLSYGDCQFNHMIDCWSPLSESTLRISNKFVELEKPDQSFVGHMLYCFAEAVSHCYWAVISWIWAISPWLRYRDDCCYFPWSLEITLYLDIIKYYQKVVECIWW